MALDWNYTCECGYQTAAVDGTDWTRHIKFQAMKCESCQTAGNVVAAFRFPDKVVIPVCRQCKSPDHLVAWTDRNCPKCGASMKRRIGERWD